MQIHRRHLIYFLLADNPDNNPLALTMAALVRNFFPGGDMFRLVYLWWCEIGRKELDDASRDAWWVRWSLVAWGLPANEIVQLTRHFTHPAVAISWGATSLHHTC